MEDAFGRFVAFLKNRDDVGLSPESVRLLHNFYLDLDAAASTTAADRRRRTDEPAGDDAAKDLLASIHIEESIYQVGNNTSVRKQLQGRHLDVLINLMMLTVEEEQNSLKGLLKLSEAVVSGGAAVAGEATTESATAATHDTMDSVAESATAATRCTLDSAITAATNHTTDSATASTKATPHGAALGSLLLAYPAQQLLELKALTQVRQWRQLRVMPLGAHQAKNRPHCQAQERPVAHGQVPGGQPPPP